MTNYEAIMTHKEKFEEWVNSKDGVDNVLRKRIVALVIANCIDCEECPVIHDCFLRGGRKSCLEYMKELLDEECRGDNNGEH